MGNLLGSPITEKETHVGITTRDGNADPDSSPDGMGMSYGVSSMQGWRVHMEDAHICQPFLYAERRIEDINGIEDNGSVVEATLASPASLASLKSGLATEVNVTETAHATPKAPAGTTGARVRPSRSSSDLMTSDDGKRYRIPLPGHALFAVFDGHGGSFAAEYASRNLLRVLCRSPGFCEYADRWRARDDHLRGVLGADGGAGEATLHPPSKRGREGDEKDGGGDATDAAADGGKDDGPAPKKDQRLEFARATYDHELMTLLENALKDAFLDLDAEILREVHGLHVQDANLEYGDGYAQRGANQRGTGNHAPGTAPDHAMAADGDGAGGNPDPNPPAPGPILPPFDEEMRERSDRPHPVPSEDEDAGTTAVCVLTTPRWIVCANAGDSRAVYSRSGHRAVPLSYDHKPDDEEEERRVREAGGYVSGGRVEGDLAVSRGLGDFRFKDPDVALTGSEGERTNGGRPAGARAKGGDDAPAPVAPSEQKVSPVPDIIVQNRDRGEDEFVLIACDGIWDVQSNQECVRMVADIFGDGEADMGLVCEEVLDLCLIKGSKDNMTACVVRLPKQAVGEGGGVAARRERRGASSAADGDGGRGRGAPRGGARDPRPPPREGDGGGGYGS